MRRFYCSGAGLLRIKICGITRLDDAIACVEAGADAIGLVFYAPSPRYLGDLALARQIALAVGPFVTVVGLFVNPEESMVRQVLERVPLHLLQFHGEEGSEFCERFRRPYMKVLRVQQGVNIQAFSQAYSSAAGVLLDTYKKGVPGGTGERFDWQLVPKSTDKPFVLAGGLSPSNVADAVRITTPYGVDVSGGVELAPGIKDKQKINAFITSARSELTSD